MRFLLFSKSVSLADGAGPSPVRRRLSGRRPSTVAFAFAGLMTLLSGVAQRPAKLGRIPPATSMLSPDLAARGSERNFLGQLARRASASWGNKARVASSQGLSRPIGVSVSPAGRPLVPLKECPYDKTKAPECRVHWRQLLISSAVFLTWQNTANAYSSYWYRHETMTGKWWERYVNSVVGYKYSVWSDGNPFLDDYIGHPLMGSLRMRCGYRTTLRG